MTARLDNLETVPAAWVQRGDHLRLDRRRVKVLAVKPFTKRSGRRHIPDIQMVNITYNYLVNPTVRSKTCAVNVRGEVRRYTLTDD